MSDPEPSLSAPPARAAVAGDAEHTSTDAKHLDSLMDRYATGDDVVFGELYDGLAPRLRAHVLRHTRDQARADDVVQQTMLQIHRARGQFVRGARVLPWAFAIARRLLIDTHRRGGREVLARGDGDEGAVWLEAVDPDAARADDAVYARELGRRLEAELGNLPQAQRTAFELVKLDGLSLKEAAETLGTTTAAVKLRAHRAYQALREALGDLAPASGKGKR